MVRLPCVSVKDPGCSQRTPALMVNLGDQRNESSNVEAGIPHHTFGEHGLLSATLVREYRA